MGALFFVEHNGPNAMPLIWLACSEQAQSFPTAWIANPTSFMNLLDSQLIICLPAISIKHFSHGKKSLLWQHLYYLTVCRWILSDDPYCCSFFECPAQTSDTLYTNFSPLTSLLLNRLKAFCALSTSVAPSTIR